LIHNNKRIFRWFLSARISVNYIELKMAKVTFPKHIFQYTIYISSFVCEEYISSHRLSGARGGVICWCTVLKAGRSRDRVPMKWIFLNLSNPSSCNMAQGSTQPLTEMSTRNLPEGKWRPACKAVNLTAICERNCRKMRGPRCLKFLWASTASYKDSYNFFLQFCSILNKLWMLQ
jgi:hypothetical protein